MTFCFERWGLNQVGGLAIAAVSHRRNGPTCFKPLSESLSRIDLLEIAALTVRKFSCTSAFVLAIRNNTPPSIQNAREIFGLHAERLPDESPQPVARRWFLNAAASFFSCKSCSPRESGGSPATRPLICQPESAFWAKGLQSCLRVGRANCRSYAPAQHNNTRCASFRPG
jgi:hypothetical protein